MSASANIQCRPTPRMWVTAGTPVLAQVDERGKLQADEAGNILQPDPDIVLTHGDEKNHTLTDELGRPTVPESPDS